MAQLIGLKCCLRSEQRSFGCCSEAGQFASLGALDLLGAGLPKMAHVLRGWRVKL